MERKPPPKVLQLKAVCITLPFVLCIKNLGPPRRARGLPSFIYMISIMPMRMYSLFLSPGTGFDQSAQSLAAFYNMPPPAVGQVVCRHQSFLCQKPQLAE